jgi:2'-5' RNA ligase
MKTHQAALVILVPEQVCGPIQEIRRMHDRHFARWMPHITLLYPFWPRERFAEARRRIADVCNDYGAFRLRLEGLRSFLHGRAGSTAWLSPEPAEPVRELQKRLQEVFPECDDAANFDSGYTPHLTVGQASENLDAVMQQMRSVLHPVEFEVQGVALIDREGDEPFRLFDQVEFP